MANTDTIINKKIHYQGPVEFKGTVIRHMDSIGKYYIQVYEWLGQGYPHMIYYLTQEEINKYATII